MSNNSRPRSRLSKFLLEKLEDRRLMSASVQLVDGMLVLGAVQKGDSLIRTLTVKRLAGRKTSHIPAEFEIVAGKGIAFLKPRIPIKILTPKKIRSRN